MSKAETPKRKIPRRTCVACSKSDAKQGLVRFVRSKEGKVACDRSGRASGRGAYLCASEECFSAAEKRGRLGAALKCQLSHEDYQHLKKEFRGICTQVEQEQAAAIES